MDKVKLVFTPYPSENKLIGKHCNYSRKIRGRCCRNIMVKDIPSGKYIVKTGMMRAPEAEKTVVFAKYGNLGETEYNIEFWLSE
jgi:hypothetical protein